MYLLFVNSKLTFEPITPLSNTSQEIGTTCREFAEVKEGFKFFDNLYDSYQVSMATTTEILHYHVVLVGSRKF